MDTFLYIIIFIMGTFFGSFYTLSVYRIPKRQDIVHTHSYCPNCNHKLGLFDLFPVFSYIFLGGKCRYCKQKIRPRYLILEALSGILFVVMALLLGIRIDNLNVQNIRQMSFMALYLTFLILIAGIDKETKKIDKYVNIYGIVISLVYMIYLCVIENTSIYRYVIYIIGYIIMLLIGKSKKYKDNNNIQIIIMSITIAIFTGEYILFNTLLLTIMSIMINLLIERIKNNKQKEENEIVKQIPIGFCLSFSNILLLICILGYINYIV